jgi:SAM-dependent methyltransferase
MNAIHTAAQQGFSSASQAYARGRPDYPVELDDWLCEQLGVGPGTRVLDLGAGTGKFTRRLQATGADVLAVEPVDAMRQTLARDLPGVTVLSGVAEHLPVADASVDAVVCAQAFHWFANSAALREIARVLRPDGRLGLVWNVRDESVDWVAAITRIITPYEGDAPRFHTGQWRAAFDDGPFVLPAPDVFGHQHVGPAQEVVMDRFMSVSFIAALPPAERERVAHQLQTLVDTHPALQEQQTLVFPYQTLAFACIRRDLPRDLSCE